MTNEAGSNRNPVSIFIASCYAIKPFESGDEGDRTPGLGVANAALSQLSYIPT
jgi:hypothetical protein